MDSKGTISQYKKLWFYAFKEAEAIMGRTKLGLSSARDQILEEANENYRKILEKGNENYRKNIEETSAKYRISNQFGPSPKITEEKNAKYRITKLLEQSPKLLEPTSNREGAHSILPFSAILVTACMITTMIAYHVTTICKKLLQGRHTCLADIKTEDDLLKLSTRQIKEFLGMSGVEFGEDVHEEELQRLLKQLWLQGERNSSLVPVKHTKEEEDRTKCKLCMDADIDSVILDCGHLVACNQCGNKLRECPICRQHVVEVRRVVLVSELEVARLTRKET